MTTNKFKSPASNYSSEVYAKTKKYQKNMGLKLVKAIWTLGIMKQTHSNILLLQLI